MFNLHLQYLSLDSYNLNIYYGWFHLQEVETETERKGVETRFVVLAALGLTKRANDLELQRSTCLYVY